MTIPFAGSCRLKLQLKKPQAVSACGFKKMIYLAQYRQAGIKIIPEIKIKVVCFAGGHRFFPFITICGLYRLVFPASQALNF
jgi:hypothetical protein